MKISEFIGFCLLVLTVVTGGCSSARRIKYVPVESISLRTDTLFIRAERIDSVIDRDSVMIFHSGDTIRVEQIKWRTRIREKHDTLRTVTLVRDTVTKIIEIPANRSNNKDTLYSRRTFGFILALSIILLIVTGILIKRHLKNS